MKDAAIEQRPSVAKGGGVRRWRPEIVERDAARVLDEGCGTPGLSCERPEHLWLPKLEQMCLMSPTSSSLGSDFAKDVSKVCEEGVPTPGFGRSPTLP